MGWGAGRGSLARMDRFGGVSDDWSCSMEAHVICPHGSHDSNWPGWTGLGVSLMIGVVPWRLTLSAPTAAVTLTGQDGQVWGCL